jgi:hypothetical protein
VKRSDLELIQRYFANTRPDLRTAPVVEHTEWRRIVTAIGQAFQGSPWAHLHDPEAWLNGTGADVREPAPAVGEPYEVDGAWYNLTESEALSRGLVPDPSEPCWRVPRNLDSAGVPYHDAVNRTIMDAATGEWRAMTPSEVAQYPAPAPVNPADYADAREDSARRDYCRVEDPTHMYVCTRPRGHTGLHAAMRSSGVLLRAPWAAPTPVPPAARAPVRHCGDEYEDDDGEIHVCTERRGHDDDQSSHYDPDIEHSDGDITW